MTPYASPIILPAKGGPLNVNIYNKTDQPLYVNWKKSALIRDERSTSLYNNYIMVSGAASAAIIPIIGVQYAASRTNIAAPCPPRRNGFYSPIERYL